jgi:signal transduction histidine kinase
MTLAQFRGLTLRMLLFAAAALLPVLLLMAWMGWLNTEEKIAHERTRAAHLAELLAREQALPFALGRQKLHDLSLMRALAAPLDGAACRAMLRKSVAETGYLSGINLYSPEGVGLCSSAPTLPPPVADRNWFRQALTSERAVVSDYLSGRVSGKSIVVMALALPDPRGGTRAVLALGIDLAWMGRTLASVPVAEGTNIVVVDGAGTVLAPERWLGRSVADHPVFKRISGITGQTSFEATGIDGIERIFVARPLNQDLGGKSYLWVASPKSSVAQAALRDFLGSTVLVFTTVLALFAAIWWEGSRMVLRPVRYLREAAQRLGGAQLAARTDLPHGEDEIGRLAASFDEMAEKIESREHELEHSRESLLRANRALRVLLEGNHASVRATDETSLLVEMCSIATAEGGYRLAWIGRAEQNPERSISVQASAGIAQEYLREFAVSWADTEQGRGPAGTAVRENRPIAVHSVTANSRFAPWRAQAMQHGIESVLGLPVSVAGTVWGVLCLYAAQTDAFDAEETRLLEELADDLGRGIETLRLRAEKQTAEDALRGMMDELERRVEERTAELEQVNREMKTFSYSISHDLRAPLRAIDGFAEALEEECGTALTPPCQEHLARIRAAAQRMSSLIEDMIRLARISETEIRAVHVDLSALAATIGAELAAAHPGRELRLTVAPGLGTRGDPGLLRALLQNLLENAWKFTARSEQAEVEFGAAQLASGERAYYVRDNGAGFDMQFAERLFRPFSRLHRSEDYAGTGIGLATVARIVSRHGGRVWASGEKGRGASFHFVLG